MNCHVYRYRNTLHKIPNHEIKVEMFRIPSSIKDGLEFRLFLHSTLSRATKSEACGSHFHCTYLRIVCLLLIPWKLRWYLLYTFRNLAKSRQEEKATGSKEEFNQILEVHNLSPIIFDGPVLRNCICKVHLTRKGNSSNWISLYQIPDCTLPFSMVSRYPSRLIPLLHKLSIV